MRQRFWSVFAVAVLIALVATFIFTQYEQVTEAEPVPPAAEARRDRFLLAARLFERLGLATARIGTLDSAETLPADAMLLVPAQRGVISRTGIQRLTGFVEAGGHLVIESERYGLDDPLYAAFGIESAEYDWGDSGPWDTGEYDESDKQAEYPADWVGVVAIRTDGDTPVLRVLMRGGEALTATTKPLWKARDRGGTRALAVAVGRGRVTAVNDIGFATNFDLARADNATFLHALARATDAKRVLFYRGHNETLGQWLLRNAWAVLLALAALIVLWLWRVMPRFGPLLPDPEPVRRRLLDHLAASGRFFWSRGQKNRLVVSACRHAQAALLRRHPHLRGTGDAEQAAFIARRFGIAPATAQRIIEPPLVRDARDLIDLTRACADLERELARHPTQPAARTSP
jgi:hypothetical protein